MFNNQMLSIPSYSAVMRSRNDVLRDTRMSQSELSRLSGVRQPSISQFLSGKVDLSDEQLDRLLSCMGYRLEIIRRPVVPELTRSEWRSWRLHRLLSTHLSGSSFQRMASDDRTQSGTFAERSDWTAASAEPRSLAVSG
jgi:predicted XRE-type DNA-binding protein